MIRHVVLFRFAEGTTHQEVARLSDGLSSLPGLIPQIAAYTHGADLGIVDGTWDYALVADFATREDYEVYGAHPDHMVLLEDLVKPIVADKARVQLEI